MPEANAVRQMFAGISSRYDLANHVLSMGIDYYWRHRLVNAVEREHPKSILDLATGSGDVAFALRKRLGPAVEITGLDFCQPMLDQAMQKQKRKPLFLGIPFIQGDILHLPFPDASFDVATIAFGLRNLENREAGLKEILRVLKPKGTLVCLEFTQPARWFSPLYYFYIKYILPPFASLLTGDRGAYKYLGATIEAFPDKEQLSQQILASGFDSVKADGLTCSIVALHHAKKAAD